jgi:hypothetical protein
MKLIADDEDFNPLINWVKVFLNDTDVTNKCTEVDDIEGYAVCLKLNEQGHFYIEQGKGSLLAVETLHGNVRIELNPDAPDAARELFNQLQTENS